MADPFSWMMVAQSAMSAGSAIMGGNAEYSQGMHEAGVATENARRARESARQIRKAGSVAQEAKSREIRRSLGRSAAAASQGGVGGPSYGSQFSLLKQASTEGELDVMNTAYGYETDAYGQDVDALSHDAAATAAKRRARGARKAGFVNAAAALLNVGSSYSGMRSQRGAAQPRSAGSSRGAVSYGSPMGIATSSRYR